MSSPSSASAAGKRKRSSSHLHPEHIPKSSTADLLQPSSRDASGEEGDESASASELLKNKQQHQQQQQSTPPSAKRARTAEDTTETKQAQLSSSNGAAEQGKEEDPGEPSETTEASADIETRSKRKASSKDSFLQTPLRAGLQDPVGYHTNPPPTGRPVRVYADGVFDLFHLGHMRQLEQAKKAFPEVYLIVGVTGDEETHQRKGLTVLSGAERSETVRHCKWVDEVIADCPWIVTPEFLAEHQIDYVAHDDLPYQAAEGDDIYAPIKEQGKFLVTQRTEGVSTTGIITKVVRDYDKYIARQFKRGASRQELNVSWLKKNELEIKRHVNELRESIRSNWNMTGQELTREIRQFWGNSRSNSPARSTKNGADMHSPRSSISKIQFPGRPESPGPAGRHEDFATGYSLGLIGGVRSWMTRTRSHQFTSGPTSPVASDDDRDGASFLESGDERRRPSVLRGESY
ncbi:choline-phosphate cytidylyltransferase [Talaromyces islandicus]|uniref:choline-phosphate cytidylyltransferase n=1 Tax=Talaromyces islandicus TaxID=28573 RepID=A0A0U1LPN6_TALIS|nr:choline-phosphate cytidylyltransferase [Talaromyces islandicus]